MNSFLVMVLVINLVFYFIISVIYFRKNFIEEEFINKDKLIIDKLYPFGFFVYNLFNINCNSYYSRKILNNVEIIYGEEEKEVYFKLIFSRKVNLVYCFFNLYICYFIIRDFNIRDLVLILIISLCGVFFVDYDLYRKKEMIRREILIELPQFINKIILLLSAGLIMRNAWERIVLDNDKENILYKNAKITLQEINNGEPEIKAYENFSRRCGVSQVNKLILTIIQNLKKGNSDIILYLKYQAEECWETRKNLAKKLGEEASTKVVFPMIIILISILIIILAPVIIMLNNF